MGADVKRLSISLRAEDWRAYDSIYASVQINRPYQLIIRLKYTSRNLERRCKFIPGTLSVSRDLLLRI